MSDKPVIGFIGLGLMGAAMVRRLQSLGYKIHTTANRNRAPIEAAVASGATEHPNPAGVAAESDILMLCVDTSDAVEKVMLGDNGAMGALKAGAIVIDFGTSLPTSTRMLADKAAERGAVFMDAPLGRTPVHAEDGKLNIMGAGPEETFGKVKPVLDDLGENVFHVGPTGAGHELKLINNFYAQACAMGMAEAFVRADKAGIDRKTLYSVMSAGPLASGMMDFIRSYGIDGDPNSLKFSIVNARKDVGYFAQNADASGVGSDLAEGILKVLDGAIADGFGDRYLPEAVAWFEKRVGK